MRKVQMNSIRDGDRMTEGWKESVEMLMNSFFPGSNRSFRAEDTPGEVYKEPPRGKPSDEELPGEEPGDDGRYK